MTRRGLTARNTSAPSPIRSIAPAENDSNARSAQRARSNTTSRPASEVTSSSSEYLPAAELCHRAVASPPSFPARNGPDALITSGRDSCSIRTTLAPRSARSRVANGPASTQLKSRICNPASGRSSTVVSPVDDAARPLGDVATGCCRALQLGPSTVVSPRLLRPGPTTAVGSRSTGAHGPGKRTGWPSTVAWSQKPRASS